MPKSQVHEDHQRGGNRLVGGEIAQRVYDLLWEPIRVGDQQKIKARENELINLIRSLSFDDATKLNSRLQPGGDLYSDFQARLSLALQSKLIRLLSKKITASLLAEGVVALGHATFDRLTGSRGIERNRQLVTPPDLSESDPLVLSRRLKDITKLRASGLSREALERLSKEEPAIRSALKLWSQRLSDPIELEKFMSPLAADIAKEVDPALTSVHSEGAEIWATVHWTEYETIREYGPVRYQDVEPMPVNRSAKVRLYTVDLATMELQTEGRRANLEGKVESEGLGLLDYLGLAGIAKSLIAWGGRVIAKRVARSAARVLTSEVGVEESELIAERLTGRGVGKDINRVPKNVYRNRPLEEPINREPIGRPVTKKLTPESRPKLLEFEPGSHPPSSNEYRVGKFLDSEAQQGRLPGIARVRGRGKLGADYELIHTDGSTTLADLWNPTASKFIGNPPNLARAMVGKVARNRYSQAEILFVELQGDLRRISVVESKEASQLAFNSGTSLNRIVFIKNGEIIADTSR